MRDDITARMQEDGLLETSARGNGLDKQYTKSHRIDCNFTLSPTRHQTMASPLSTGRLRLQKLSFVMSFRNSTLVILGNPNGEVSLT